jgi:hypothetical protein
MYETNKVRFGGKVHTVDIPAWELATGAGKMKGKFWQNSTV